MLGSTVDTCCALVALELRDGSSSPDALLLHSARMEKCAQSMLRLQFTQRVSQLETLDVLLRVSRG